MHPTLYIQEFRIFDHGTAVAGNIDRMEVTKTPTPDMPANAVGGSINLISKSGLSRQTPLLRYEVFATFNQLGGVEEFHPRLGQAAGPDSKSTTSYIQPAFNLSYILPLTKSLAFTFAASYAARRSDQVVMTPTWDRVKLIQTTNQTNNTVSEEIPKMISGKIEWKAGERDFFSASFLHSEKAKLVRQSTLTATLGANATGGSTFTQGASTAVGSVTQAFNNWSETRILDHATLTYRHDADRWKMDASLAYSAGSYSKIDVDDGYFSTITTTNGSMIVRMDGLDGISDGKIPRITGVTAAGRPVDIFNGQNLSITATTSAPLEGRNEILRAAANVGRDFQLAVPFSLKGGW